MRALDERAAREEKRMVEAALRESDDRLRELAANLDSVLFVVDGESAPRRFSYVSPAFDATWGVGRDRLMKHPGLWMEAMHPDDREQAKAEFQQCTALAGGDMEFRIVRPDGEVRWIRTRLSPVFAKGKLLRVVGISDDITAWKAAEAERQRLESELSQAQKMESIGRLAGGVAHDFNNMICVIMGYAQLAKARLAPLDPLLSDLDEIERAAGRARDITSQLLAFSRKQVMAPKVLDLNQHIEAARGVLSRLVGEDIRIQFERGEGLWPVRFDASQLDQILVNLAANARDAMPQGGRLEIRTANLPAEDSSVCRRPALTPRDYVRLTVADSGVGMSEEVLQHAFEPFFTTKEVGKGTGLGLATVYGIIRQSGAWIDVDSRLGQGTTFHVLIPRHEGEAAPEAATVASTVARGSGSVLLVEDDPMVRRMTAGMLRSMGYSVVPAAAPDEALAVMRSQTRRFDLLLADVVMPGMSGPELREQIEVLQPGIPTLFVSGYAPEAVTRRGLSEDSAEFLQKPFSFDELSHKVRLAMARS